MKIILISVGNMREAPLKELAERYSGRIPHYIPFESIVIPDIPSSKNLSKEAKKTKEGENILSKIAVGDHVVLLDERGREMTSREFSALIERKATTLSRNLVFIIGGPFGFSQAVYDRADAMMSLSRMTFTHEMARVLTLEQLYRAMTIMRG